MMGQLYTSYVGKIKSRKFNDKTRVFTIMKFPFSKHDNLYDLAPKDSYDDLKNMRCTFEQFKILYRAEMKAEKSIDCMDQIYLLLEEGYDVILCCCESNRRECHRAVLGDIMEKRYNIIVQEL